LIIALLVLIWCLGVLVYRFVSWVDKLSVDYQIRKYEQKKKTREEDPIEEVKPPYVNHGYLLTEDYRKRKIHRMMTVVEISIFNKTNQRVKLQYPETDDEVLKLQSMYDGAMGKK
jgi:hypothetical protein